MNGAATGKKRRLKKRHGWWIWIVLGALLVVAAMAGGVILETNRINSTASNAIEMIRDICFRYDSYRLGERVDDLQALINKANILSIYTENVDLSREEVLARYARNQYLSGIIVLDDSLNVVGSLDLAGERRDSFLSFIRNDEDTRNILDYPQKVYASRYSAGGCELDYAMVSRRSVGGVIVCYSDAQHVADEQYELSLNTMLTPNMVDDDAVYVITDGERVLSTNSARLTGRMVEECPITDVAIADLLKSNGELLVLRSGANLWIGRNGVYRDYYIYCFYPGALLRDVGLLWAGITLCVCLFIFFIASIAHQQKQRARMRQIEKEYNLRSAVASIYSANLLIYPQRDRWEPVTQTPQLMKMINGAQGAHEMLAQLCQNGISPACREEFRQFVELDTLTERLRGKTFIGYTIEDVLDRWFQALLVPQGWDEDGNISAVMLLFHNVTEQWEREMDYQERLSKTAEEAAMANAAKTDFLRRMSHDIRTPINGICGMAEIGKACAGNAEKTNQCFDKILTASGFLLELVNNVLEMSKLEGSEVKEGNTPFAIGELLTSALTMVESQAAAMGVTVEVEPPRGEHLHLIGSPLNVQQIVQNIMANAVKYNRPGGSVHVKCEEKSSDGEKAVFVFTCADTGVGMSEEFQKHAFEPFVQENAQARTNYPGSGLGLAIAKKTVDYLGGEISFVSEQGKGTTFTVTLPLRIDRDYKAEEPKKQETDDSIEGVSILLAEDNKLNQEIAEFVLQGKGAKVALAQNGQQAVERFAASKPGEFDLILMDIMMPVLNGLEATRRIRAMERSDAAEIPIFAMTANAFAEDIALSREAGVNEHVPKPLDFEQLAVLIHRYCAKKE